MNLNINLQNGFQRRAFRVFSILAAILVGMFNAAASSPFNTFPVFVLTFIAVMGGSVGLCYIITGKLW